MIDFVNVASDDSYCDKTILSRQLHLQPLHVFQRNRGMCKKYIWIALDWVEWV